MSGARDYFIIFTDGACSGNPGPGGWGSIVLAPNDEVQELGAGEFSTTNNRMEMTAVLMALEYLGDLPGPVQVYTDSTYVIRGITQWVWAWRRNSWKTAEGKEVSNKDLWEALSQQVQKRKALGGLQWHYTRGHMGTPGNERCDTIAVRFSKREPVNLFRGPLREYSVDLLQVSPEPLPEMKSKNSAVKAAPFSYLSNIGGIVYRHKDWASCERRVKGQSGAKYKKTKSAAEEKEVLASWGLSSETKLRED